MTRNIAKNLKIVLSDKFLFESFFILNIRNTI